MTVVGKLENKPNGQFGVHSRGREKKVATVTGQSMGSANRGRPPSFSYLAL